MKILAPISSADEVEMLAENGAEEFYCGIVPREWLEVFSGAVWLNRRSPKGGNLETYASLGELVVRAHRYRIPVFLTLNAPVYNRAQLDLIAPLARRAIEDIGVDALIVSDLGLLLTLAEAGLGSRLHISSIASALNSASVSFYRDLGAARVILPRALSVNEIEAIVSAVGGAIGLEVFILNDGCAFEEGLCFTMHHHRVGAFCSNLIDWPYQVEDDTGGPIEGEARAPVDEHVRRYREWIWVLNGCGGRPSPSGLPCGPCGLCAIPEFHRMGITSLKIVGREASSWRKLVSLRLVKTVVDLVRAGASPQDVVARARRIRNTPELCDAGYLCYYRGSGRIGVAAATGEMEG